MFNLLASVLLCLVYATGKRAFLSCRDRERRWRQANAGQRERIVQKECAWRVLGRLLGAGGLVLGAFTVFSPGLAVVWALAAWRMVRPIRSEISDASEFYSTGAPDERPYPW